MNGVHDLHHQVTISVNTLLNILCMFKMLRFHGRVSLITETLTRALVELGHFVIVAGYVLIGYAFLAWQVLGTQVEEFRTMQGAVRGTCRWAVEILAILVYT